MSDGRLTLMAVHAHPDDEIFGTGGALARAAAEGVRTVLVTATRGEEGEIRDPSLDAEEARPRLGQIREAELRRSAEVLGISELYILGYRDSGMAGTPANEDERSFNRADREEVVQRLVRLIREVRPHVMVTYDERGGYGHPDHIAAHRAAIEAFDAAGDATRFPEDGAAWQPLKLYYTAFSWSRLRRLQELARQYGIEDPFGDGDQDPESFTVPDERITTRVDVRPYLPQIDEAVHAHPTQISPDDPFLHLPREVGEEFWSIETFIRVRSLVPVPEQEDDLFAGLHSGREQTSEASSTGSVT